MNIENIKDAKFPGKVVGVVSGRDVVFMSKEIFLERMSNTEEIKISRGARKAAISPKAGLMVIALNSGNIEAWEFPGLRKVAVMRPSREEWYEGAGRNFLAISLDVSSTGRVAMTSIDGYLRVFDCVKGIELFNKKYERPPTAVGWSPDGNMLAIGTENGKVMIMDSDGYDERPLMDFKNPVITISWSPDSAKISVGGYSSHVAIYSVGEKVQKTRIDMENRVTAIKWLDDETLAIGTKDGSILIWRNQPLRILNGHATTINSISHEEDILASGSSDLTFRLWNWRSGDLLDATEPFIGRIIDVSIHDGIVYGISGTGVLIKRKVYTGLSLSRKTFPARVTVAAISHGGMLAAGGEGGEIWVWNSETGDFMTAGWHRKRITDLEWNGRKLASSSMDYTIRVWEYKSPFVPLFLEDSNNVLTIAWLDDQRLISANWKGEIKIWNIERKEVELAKKLLPSRPATLAVSPDKKYLAMGDVNGNVVVSNMKLEEVFSEKVNFPVKRIKWFMDSKSLTVNYSIKMVIT